MQDLTKPLSQQEMDELGDALSGRIPEDADVTGTDEGIFEISGLDGFLTAVVSLPMTLVPSQWLPSLWGDYPPVFDGSEDMERIFHLVFRHLNDIADSLINRVDEFEPIYYRNMSGGEEHLIVDEWCEGYIRGIELGQQHGLKLSSADEEALAPIRGFTEAAGWPAHDLPRDKMIGHQKLIVHMVRTLYLFWLERREGPGIPDNAPYRREEPKVGRNDPCPCGSGRKFKKCCLH